MSESSARGMADGAVVNDSTARTPASLVAEASELWEKVRLCSHRSAYADQRMALSCPVPLQLEMEVADIRSTATDMKKIVDSMKGKLDVLREAVALGKDKRPPVFFLVNEDNASLRRAANLESDGSVDA